MNNNRPERTIVIIGMGLIGGSLGMALVNFARTKNRRWRIVGLGRRHKSMALAKRRRACHEATGQWAPAVARADDIVICTPPLEVIPVIKKIVPWVKPGAVLSDVASVKEPILKGWDDLKSRFGSSRDRSFSFIGAHPMAGSEASGIRHARADMFQDAVCAITPPQGAGRAAIERVESLWRFSGAHPLRLEASLHDKIVALTSHLPHVLASGLILAILKRGSHRGLTERFIARSFLDLTRVAASNPDMWSEIFQMNQIYLKDALKDLESIIGRLCGGKSRPLLHQSALFRRRWSS